MKSKFLILIFFFTLTSCRQIQKVSDAISNPSAKTIFERDFQNNDSLYKLYEVIYSDAKNNNLKLKLPIVLQSQSSISDFKTLAYTVNLQQGERFKIESNTPADSLQLALDLFLFENDSLISEKSIVSNNPKSNNLVFDVTKTGRYKIIILPFKKKNINFAFKLFTEPSFAFPVSGKNNKDIQSFWGASRGGGNRSHEGIDIFAKRGTPIVAATSGFISNTGNRGLGGKQVWLRDGIFGQSLYYAHLDSIMVSASNRVKVGDTLGLVGNTGNAKTTSPHLHFGIYTTEGAIDPLPFVKIIKPIQIENLPFFKKGETRLNKNELRIEPDSKSKMLQTLGKNTPIEIVSMTKQWFHIQVNDTLQGFIHESLVKELE